MQLGVIALLGSGETGPSMTKVHRRLFNRLEDVRAVALDTSYAFQANVPQMTEKIIDYFATSLKQEITVLHLGGAEAAAPVDEAKFRQEIGSANYVFAGPGSPSYALERWSRAGVKNVLADVLHADGVVCFASAAALTLGTFTVPIYEIYKAGASPSWLDGLDVLSLAGLKCAVIPHYDNAEGKNYDTRFCYLGETRLAALEGKLADDAGILGVDEHTAAIIDLRQDTVSVIGRSNVYWRRRGVTNVLENGSVTPLSEIRSFEPSPVAFVAPDVSPSNVEALTLTASLGGPPAVEALAKLSRLANRSNEEMIDPAPLITSLLRLRDGARSRKDFDLSDQIRDALLESGIEVMDSPDGSRWAHRSP
jgi:hypothetical protein